MRGWIYVAAARGAPERVRIGHAAVDPRSDASRGAGELRYDAVVDAPRDVLGLVQARLRTLRDVDGTFRCSPEFAIAAIHHALGGPPPGERIYEYPAAGPLAGHGDAPPAMRARRAERGGSTTSFAVPAVGMVAVAVLAGWLATRALPQGATVADDVSVIANPAPAPPRAAVLPRDLPPIVAPASAPPAAPEVAVASGVEPPRDIAAAEPPDVGDCAALESLLTQCAARRGRGCADGTAGLAPRERRVLTDLQRAGTAYDARALENFCRAACRHGYRPAHADFASTVCRAP